MITVILGFILGIVICLVNEYRDYKCIYGEDVMLAFLGGMLGGLCGCVLAFIIGACTVNAYQYEDHIETKTLISISDQSTVEGRKYFLGSGWVNEEMTFFSYYQDNEGYKVHKSNAKNSIVRYTDGEPKIETHYKLPMKQKWYMYFGFDLSCGCNNEKHIYYVPEGSIQSNYNLDL